MQVIRGMSLAISLLMYNNWTSSRIWTATGVVFFDSSFLPWRQRSLDCSLHLCNCSMLRSVFALGVNIAKYNKTESVPHPFQNMTMDAQPLSRHNLPHSPHRFQTSRPLIGLIIATVMLAVLLVYSTLANIHRTRTVMEKFLRDKGETVIRSLEAGGRTSMMMQGMMGGGGNPLHTLLVENGKEKDILFIRLSGRDGSILDETGHPSSFSLGKNDIARLLSTGKSLISIDATTGMFVVSRVFRFSTGYSGGGMMGRMGSMPGMGTYGISGNSVISIGLSSTLFDDARRQDVHHAMFMAAILFLVGAAGLYFLFLYQRMRIARMNLADMKLYTDNVFESIPVGLVALDTGNRIVSCNRKTEEILGRSLETIRGVSIHDAFPNCPLHIEDICNDMLDHPSDCLRADEKVVPVSINGSYLVNHLGKKIGKVLIIKDMSAISDMKVQLERSRRMAALGQMAAGIAHEIRNPLGTLRGFAHYFGNQPGAGEETKNYADLMVSEVDRLNQTVSSLLQFARPREPQMRRLSLDELFAKTVSLMKADLANKHLDFHTQTNTGISFTGDPDLLLQILMNLLKNSIASTESGDEISLLGSEDRHFVRITVADTGCGMTDQEKERMFDPFFTTKKTGTGLGLTVSHQIIEQHKGSFEIRSPPEKAPASPFSSPKNNGNDLP